MSTSNQQKPQGSGDVEHTQELPRVEKSSSSARTSTGASPASRSVAGSSTQSAAPSSKPAAKKSPKKAPAKKAASSQPTTVGEKLAADAASKTSGPAGTEGKGSSATPPASTQDTAKESAKVEKSSEASSTKGSSGTAAKVAGAAGAGAAVKKATGKATSKDAGSSSAKKTSPSAARSDTQAKAKESPMTARDYARTTGGGVDSTSVIPAVRDEPTSATPTAAPVTPAEGSQRSARLRLVHVEPWSVTRLAFVVSVALMIVSVVAVAIFWLVLDLAGVWDSLNGTITNVLSDGETGFDLTDYLGIGRLLGLTLLLSAINVIVMTMIATIAAHLYNLAAQLLGGVNVTFSDK